VCVHAGFGATFLDSGKDALCVGGKLQQSAARMQDVPLLTLLIVGRTTSESSYRLQPRNARTSRFSWAKKKRECAVLGKLTRHPPGPTSLSYFHLLPPSVLVAFASEAALWGIWYPKPEYKYQADIKNKPRALIISLYRVGFQFWATVHQRLKPGHVGVAKGRLVTSVSFHSLTSHFQWLSCSFLCLEFSYNP
jgi:hypothetical protein